MVEVLKDYAKLLSKASSHWDDDNQVNPNHFGYVDLSHIIDTANKISLGSNDYKITDLKLTNNDSCVEYSVKVGEERKHCPSYFLLNK